ncbi:MAG: hypothetical protein GC154_12620 [bacterium]|nr:hypothetical protein [bacterium]
MNKLAQFTALAIAAALIAAGAARAQDLSTTFSSGSKQVLIGSDTQWQAENPFSDSPVLHLTPKPGVQAAKVTITEGTRTTIYTARKIDYWSASGALYMAGAARIERGDEYIAGPISIDYQPQNLKMIATGDKKSPAIIRYLPPTGMKIYTEAVEFLFAFEKEGDANRVKSITPVDQIQTILGDEAVTAGLPIDRQLSGPKN